MKQLAQLWLAYSSNKRVQLLREPVRRRFIPFIHNKNFGAIACENEPMHITTNTESFLC